jgi:hypothetical protein
MWSDKKARLVDCIASKDSATHNNKWEEQYAELEAHAGVTVVGTKLPNWKTTQMSNGRAGLDSRIEKEIAANSEGGTVWNRVETRKRDSLIAYNKG